MAAYGVPVHLLLWLGMACFALLCGRAVNWGCVEAGEVGGEAMRAELVALLYTKIPVGWVHF